MDYRKTSEAAKKAWFVYKEKNPGMILSVTSFIAGWNAEKTPLDGFHDFAKGLRPNQVYEWRYGDQTCFRINHGGNSATFQVGFDTSTGRISWIDVECDF